MRTLTTLEAYSDDDGNVIVSEQTYDSRIVITFRGRNNRILVAPGAKIEELRVEFDCDNGTLRLGHNRRVKGGLWAIRVGQDATVAIGNNVSCTNICGISAVEGVTVRIGHDVMIATDTHIRADDGHPIFDVRTGKRVNPARSISIGNHVWLGIGAVVLAGGQIGDGSVIGWGSIVTGTIPNNCVAVGRPARVKRRDIAWERPHLALVKPYYKPDASTVRKSKYWNLTAVEPSAPAPTPSVRRRLVRRIRRLWPSR